MAQGWCLGFGFYSAVHCTSEFDPNTCGSNPAYFMAKYKYKLLGESPMQPCNTYQANGELAFGPLLGSI